jgi:hypothetical protein
MTETTTLSMRERLLYAMYAVDCRRLRNCDPAPELDAGAAALRAHYGVVLDALLSVLAEPSDAVLEEMGHGHQASPCMDTIGPLLHGWQAAIRAIQEGK